MIFTELIVDIAASAILLFSDSYLENLEKGKCKEENLMTMNFIHLT